MLLQLLVDAKCCDGYFTHLGAGLASWERGKAWKEGQGYAASDSPGEFVVAWQSDFDVGEWPTH